jgi:hypothetical protein
LGHVALQMGYAFSPVVICSWNVSWIRKDEFEWMDRGITLSSTELELICSGGWCRIQAARSVGGDDGALISYWVCTWEMMSRSVCSRDWKCSIESCLGFFFGFFFFHKLRNLMSQIWDPKPIHSGLFV